MKASIRRHGIVIRTLDIPGPSARIGSGEDCEIKIEDPYLAPHVADVVQKNDGWHIVDAGTSLEGVSRSGGRVDEEKIVGGEAYSVGGFEVFFGELGGAPDLSSRSTAAAESVPAGVVPRTIMEPYPGPSGGSDVPKTVMDVPLPPAAPPQAPPPRPAAAQAAPPPSSGPQFVPLKTTSNLPVPPPAQAQFQQPQPGPSYAPAAAPPRKSKRGLLLVGGVGAALLLLLVVLLATSGGEAPPVPEQPETTTTAEPVAETTTAPPADPVAIGNQAAAKLDLEQALSSWQTALQGSANPELQSRYAQVSYELALVYAAANDTARARQHLENVTKYGPPDSNEVRLAKARLSKL
jgi:hypothetical protein